MSTSHALRSSYRPSDGALGATAYCREIGSQRVVDYSKFPALIVALLEILLIALDSGECG